MHGEVVAASANSSFESPLEICPDNDPKFSTERLGAAASLRSQTGSQTANLARPFARRALITARPLLLFILTLNPWVRLRRVTDGW